MGAQVDQIQYDKVMNYIDIGKKVTIARQRDPTPPAPTVDP